MCSSVAAAQQPSETESAFPAWLTDTKGSVRIQREGSVIWEQASEGMGLELKWKILTEDQSSVIVHFADGNYIKLQPLGTVLIDRAQVSEGKMSDIALVERGRVWALAAPSPAMEKLIIETPSGAVDTTEGAMFVEYSPLAGYSCVDIFNGAADVRSIFDPEKATRLEKNKRTNIKSDQAPEDPADIDGSFDAENASYSCIEDQTKGDKITIGDTTVQTIADNDEYTEILIVSAIFVNFLGSDAPNAAASETGYEDEDEEQIVELSAAVTVTFEKCSAESAACESNSECCSGLCEDSVCKEQELTAAGSVCAEVDEACKSSDECCSDFCINSRCAESAMCFETGAACVSSDDCCIGVCINSTCKDELEFEARTTMTFTDPACEAPPTISGLSVAGQSVSENATIEVAGAECASSAKPSITWSAASPCVSLVSVVLKFGSETKNFGAVAKDQTGSFSYTPTISGSDSYSAEITATDGNNRSTTIKFFVVFKPHESLSAIPTISSVTFNRQSVETGDKPEITITSCNNAAIDVAGKAATACGQISRVTVKLDNSSQTVSGTADWRTSISLPAGAKAQFEIIAKNTLGKDSEPFEFEAAIIRDIPKPTAEIAKAGNKIVEDPSTPVDIYRNELESGKIVIRGDARSESCSLSKVEVSTDNGSTWKAAVGAAAWSFSFSPSEQTYEISARAVDSAGSVSEEAAQALVTYHNTTPEDDLLEIFKRLIQAYVNKNASAFTDLTSQNYSSSYDSIEDINSLDISLDNKFVANPTIYLRYSVDSVVINGDIGQVSFQWSADSSSGVNSQSAVFQFARESDGWRFTTVRDDNTFLRYTSIPATISLRSADSQITADNVSSTTITAEVRDSAHNLIKDGTQVTFSTTLGSITTRAETRSGVAEATFYSGAVYGTASISATCSTVSAIPLTILLKQEHAPPPPGP